MNNDITQLLVIALAIVPFVNAVVGLIKKSFINVPSNFTPIISVATGLVLGALFAYLPDSHYTLVQMVLAGGIAGMSACGVYEIARTTSAAPEVKTDIAVATAPSVAAPAEAAPETITNQTQNTAN